MKIKANIKLFFVALSLLFSQSAMAANPHVVNDIFKEISTYLKNADVDKLSAHFDTGVELFLPNTEKAPPAQQSAQSLSTFFEQYKPRNFSMLHIGSKSNKHYGIGMLTTNLGRFRVTVFILINDKNYSIQQLQFEDEI